MIFGTLSSLHRFPYFATVDEFTAKTGLPAPFPPYDSNYPVKSWRDPAPPLADEDGMVTYLGIALAKDGRTPLLKDGKPYQKAFRVPVEIAARVNIAFKATDPKDNRVDDPTPKGEYQMPLRELQAGESLGLGFGGVPVVVTAGSSSAQSAQTGGTLPAAVGVALRELRDEIETISAKLDLLIAVKA